MAAVGEYALARLDPYAYHASCIAKGVRADARDLDATRKLYIDTGVVPGSDGSASVGLGTSRAVAVVTVSTAAFIEGYRTQHSIDVHVSLPDSQKGPGKTSPVALYAAQVARKCLARCADVAFPAPVASKMVWHADIDVRFVSFDGAAVDITLIAAQAALRATALPHVELGPDGEVSRSAELASERIATGTLLAPLSCALVGNAILPDPTQDEEAIADCVVSVVVDEHGEVRGLYKPGATPVTQETITRCIERARAARVRCSSGAL